MRKNGTGIPWYSHRCDRKSRSHGALFRSVLAVALLSLSPFSTAAHAEQHVTAGARVDHATPTRAATVEAPGLDARTRVAFVPRDASAPVRQAGSAAPGRPQPSALHWLTQVNAVRASAGLLPLVEEVEWSAGSVLHSRYMVKNNYVGHDEDTSNPWYTPEGKAAGQHGNAYANDAHDESDPPGLDAWLTTPFHLVNVLDPRLAKTGFGWYRESPDDARKDADPDAYQVGATLDVARGLDPERRPASYPVFFPGNGQRMPYSRYFGAEHPDPLTSCPDRAFQGAPLMVQLDATPTVTSVTVMKDGLRLDRCVFDETSYRHDDAEIQALGREVLAGRHAIVIMPREPLTAGVYRVTLESGGVTHTWAFAGPEAGRSPTLVHPDAAVLPFSASLSVPPMPSLPDRTTSAAPPESAPPVRAVACSPRPDAGIGVIRETDDRLLTLVAARGANNELRQLHFGRAEAPLENATIELNGYPAPITGLGTVTLPPGTTQIAFAVQRVARGQQMRAPFTITDRCGDWSTLVEAPSTRP